MKKAASILIAGIMLLSGMHLSVANHICGGKHVATKISLSGERATCGMKSDVDEKAHQTQVKQNCCHNEIAQLNVDPNYEQSSFKTPSVAEHQLLATAPLGLAALSIVPISTASIRTNEFPPGNESASKVNLSSICVFRI
jgi:hypothetical protein